MTSQNRREARRNLKGHENRIIEHCAKSKFCANRSGKTHKSLYRRLLLHTSRLYASSTLLLEFFQINYYFIIFD